MDSTYVRVYIYVPPWKLLYIHTSPCIYVMQCNLSAASVCVPITLTAGPGSTGLACSVIVNLFSTLSYTCSAWGNDLSD